MLFLALIFLSFLSISTSKSSLSRLSILLNGGESIASLNADKDTLDELQNGIKQLSHQIRRENVPIFQIKNLLDDLLWKAINSGSVDSIQNLELQFYNYVALLKDFYFSAFMKSLEEKFQESIDDAMFTNDEYYNLRDYFVSEFETALNASIPNIPLCSLWTHKVCNYA